MFRLDNATLGYGGTVALEVDALRIDPGERVVIVGKSGAGKSTLLQALYRQAAGACALVPQELGLVKTLSVFHNVYIGALDRRPTWYNLVNLVRPLAREVQRTRQILGMIDLEDKIFEPAGELSGGQQQRTAIGRAINRECRALVGDEPVSALDEQQSRRVLEAINAKHDTVLLAMHDIRLAIDYSERMIGIRDGRIVFDQPTNGLTPEDIEHLYAD